MKRLIATSGVLVLLTALPAFATGIVEETEMTMEQAVGQSITVRGQLGTYGSEPMTFLGLLSADEPDQDVMQESGTALYIGPETLFELTGELLSELRRWQGSRIEITGILARQSTAPGIPAQVDVRSFSLPER
jgi:hypothetical protein